ncbi:GIDE domain-containing protein [Halorubrum laminariae]|uniref:GIDE domain-containing protein n=1 Tax=Halorubrum laminariae TaxID=1433523 RepID=A0ABD6BZ83_9EURY|nr:GIDE domain-containing protein [Halorubrum laminariae]
MLALPHATVPHVLSQTAVNAVPILIGVAALAVGVAFLAYGVRGSVDAFRVVRATPTDPRSLRDDDRRVRLSGRAETVPDRTADGATADAGSADDGTADRDATLPAPFTDEACLCCAYDVSEYRSQGKGRSWVTIDSGEAGVPFRVASNGSAVRVDPAAADFVFSVDEETKLNAGERPPERIRRFTDAVAAVDETDTGYEFGPLTLGDDPRRRYRQRLLRPGDEVTVVGDAEVFPDAPVGEVKSMIAGGSPFVVGDAPARRTALRLVGRSVVPLVLGIVSLTVAAVALSPLLGGAPVSFLLPGAAA